ncbi:acetyl-CoA acetyltransferase [Rhodoligotrophos appendicifer]|uniref:acetyl-CoA acetyltransferase n=1 Tax=Rhodoligotrophos appendicifer TaxID=987056 RepID=UPI001186FEA6|nr:acetyl-CoA acetyltransferase [Rhodoligotrophos appendicifer]
MTSLRGKTAIVGLGYAGLGSSPGWSPIELAAMAAERALADAGLALKDVDGLCASTFYHFFPTLSMAEQLRISPKWSNADMVGGSTFLSHVLQSALAIDAGLCETVLILYGSNARSSRDIYGLIDLHPLQALYAPSMPVSAYAMAAARHMHLYGTTRSQMAEVAVAARRWAQGNPDAALRDPLTIADVLASPMVSDPLSRLDCCLVSDGGGALVMTSAARARDLKQPPVYLLGAGMAHSHRDISQMAELTRTGAVESGARAFEMAGLSPSDVDVAELYDAFTILPILFLEDLGFCEKGEGGPFVADGAIGPGGRLPVNTGGGGLSFVHPGMFGLFAILEACVQLRGQGGARQVPGTPEIALAHGNGGYFSHQATTIFGTAATVS